jgi:multidrug resistance efflux pump
VAPKVSGYLTAVPVTDNEHVAAGGVIARIDERDYRIALEQAQAQVASAQASIENIDAQLQVQQAQINANDAQLDQAQAALVFAQQQAERYEKLEQTGSASRSARSRHLRRNATAPPRASPKPRHSATRRNSICPIRRLRRRSRAASLISALQSGSSHSPART